MYVNESYPSLTQGTGCQNELDCTGPFSLHMTPSIAPLDFCLVGSLIVSGPDRAILTGQEGKGITP